MQRRSNSIFNPKATVNILKEQRNLDEPLDEAGRKKLVARYLEVSYTHKILFKQIIIHKFSFNFSLRNSC